MIHQKSSRSLKKRLWTAAYRSMGQKRSFICSQVDSFTPEKGAIHKASPSQSYKKCNSVPKSDVTEKPKSSESPKDRFIAHLIYGFFGYYIPKGKILYVRMMQMKTECLWFSLCAVSKKYLIFFDTASMLLGKKCPKKSLQTLLQDRFFIPKKCTIILEKFQILQYNYSATITQTKCLNFFERSFLF